MAELNRAGYSVQLRHLADTETDRDEHGDIWLKTEAGEVLAASEKFQHNMNYNNRERLTSELLVGILALSKADSTELGHSASQSSL